MGLYNYQSENKQEIQEQWEKHPAVLYQLPTGGGKTVVITSIIEDILDKKILILVHRVEIILQIRDRLREKGIDCGILVGGLEENVDSDILIGSILTVARDRRLGAILDKNFDYMIIDEAHHACSDSYIKTIDSFKKHNPNYRLLGVTATPYRKDKKSLDKIFDVIVKGPTYSWLRENGFLSGYKCYPVKLEDLNNVELSGGDYKLSDLSKFMRSPELINLAIDIYKKRGENKQMLVFCVDIKHAQQVKDAYIKAGFKNTELIDSNTSYEDRMRINQQYRDGITQIIISIQTLTEGTDLPETKVVQLLRPTLSIVLYLQILGRGVRLKEDKSDLIVLDCSNNTFTHGLLDSNYKWTLNNEDPNPSKEGRRIVGKNKNGGFTLDEDDIGLDYEEVTEISHSDYLAMHGDGIEMAEKENAEKDNLIKQIIESTLEDLNKKAIKSGYKFKHYDGGNEKSIFNWDGTLSISMLEGKDYIKIVYIKNKINGGEMTQFLEYDISLYNVRKTSLPSIISVGKGTDYIVKNEILEKIAKLSEKVFKLNKEKINIDELKDNLKSIRIGQLENKMNIAISNKKFTFILKKDKYIDSRAIGWGNACSIMLTEYPKKLKTMNKCQVATTRGNTYSEVNLSKEKILEALYDNWDN